MHKVLLLLILSFYLTTGTVGCRALHRGPKIPLIGLNKAGKEIIQMVPMKSHSKNMASLINHTTDNISESLREYSKDNPWKVTRVDLNVVMTFGFSLAGIVGMDVSPGLRLQYVKK